jgi:hypothetical protein
MDNGWSKAIDVGKLPQGDGAGCVDMDRRGSVLFWAGKTQSARCPILPLRE